MCICASFFSFGRSLQRYWMHANVAVCAHTWNRQVVLIGMYLRLTRKLCLMCVIRWTCTEKTTIPFYFILFRCFYVINGNNLCLICGGACFYRSHSIYLYTLLWPVLSQVAFSLAGEHQLLFVSRNKLVCFIPLIRQKKCLYIQTYICSEVECVSHDLQSAHLP